LHNIFCQLLTSLARGYRDARDQLGGAPFRGCASRGGVWPSSSTTAVRTLVELVTARLQAPGRVAGHGLALAGVLTVDRVDQELSAFTVDVEDQGEAGPAVEVGPVVWRT
jgi:hypothetical protein